jgi:carboxymethylenebutenolidase
MKEQQLDIATKDGSMKTFITVPEEGGPYPVVLFLMDAPGKREELHDMARRIATVGYYVMLPNLYYRTAREFERDDTAESADKMREHMAALTNAMVVKDCRTMLDFSDQDSDAKAGPAGCTGYCMSGPFAFAAAAQIPDRIKASASIHGVSLCTDADDSPHLDADKIQGEMYFGCAETDVHVPTEMIEQLEAHMKTTNCNYRIEWYPGTVHGYVFPLRGKAYHKACAERHWERLFALFKRNF